MACLGITTDRIQQFASIGIPGAWIDDDESVDATICKIGGFCKYFYLWQKTKEQIECLSCNQKMYLLTQINAPLIDEECQRNIYVFMCCNSKCTKSQKGWKVIVQRGPKITAINIKNTNNDNKNINDIHKIIKYNNKQKNNKDIMLFNNKSLWNNDLNHNEIVDEKHDKIDNKLKDKMNGLNDDFSRLMAMQQMLLNQVDKKQQNTKINKKKYKKHNNYNNDNIHNHKKGGKIKKGCFSSFEIVFNDEGYYKNNKNKKTEREKTIKWKNKEIDLIKLMNNDDAKQCVDINDNIDNLEDDLLSDYLERMSIHKTQCIRYCYGDYPLLPKKIDLNKIEKCQYCGNKKIFEFQIMSNLLNYLKPKQIHHDWLTVLVFVCPLTCQQSDDQQHIIVCCEQ